MTTTAIAYIRVSTARQGKSGLGLEAQQAALARFADAEGYNLIQTFKEVETGKRADALDRRPQLAAALKAARKLWYPAHHLADCTCMASPRRTDSRVHRAKRGLGGSHTPSLCQNKLDSFYPLQ